MMWLVDGHNLIGQLQDLSLDDPYDEAKLSQAVRSYCMRSRTTAEVIFDNGLPGGLSREMSNSAVKVIFAPPRTSADNLIMRRARDYGNFRDMVLVTSDRRILRLAHAYGIETMASEEFALLIGFRPVEVEETPQSDRKNGARSPEKDVKIVFDKDPNPVVTQAEIAYWLPIFKRRLAIARAARTVSKWAERGVHLDDPDSDS
ncbi:MAG: NYN domain-containing protein [Anaerolineae bacterium]|nr:NYN domain-containing protein [Anaerolineae bacterium]